MKLITIFILFGLLHVSASTLAQRLDLQVKNASLEAVIKLIQKQSDYSFFVKAEYLKNAKPVTINIKERDLQQVLDMVLAEQPLAYRISGNIVTLVPKKEKVETWRTIEQQQQISGQVTDSVGSPLEGVSVLVKSTSIGTVTDQNGRFEIQTDPGAVLIFRTVGFRHIEVAIENRRTIDIVMAAESADLDEVVVVGYGTQRRSNVTGAVASVSAEKIAERPNSNVMQSLAGQLPGVDIMQTQGAPGFVPSVRIRGVTSITAGTSPLYVVDGVPIEGADLNIVNPQDILSVDVLKDASSAAIYGSRGANGVVLITTKTGELGGRTVIDLNYERGLQQVGRKVDMMDAQDFIQYFIDAKNNSWVYQGGNPGDPNSARPRQFWIPPDFLEDPGQFGAGTDWQDVLFRNAPSDNLQLSISGGAEKTKFLLSAGYLAQSGLVESNEFKRTTIRANVSHEISEKLRVGMNLSLAHINNRPYGVDGKSDAVSLAIQNDPIFPVFNENGNYGFRDPNSEWYRFTEYEVQLWHPYAITREIDRLDKRLNLLGTGHMEYDILPELTFKSSFSATIENSRFSEYRNEGQKYGWSAYQPAQGTASSDYMLNWIFENTLNYTKNFGDHELNGLLGYSAQKQIFEDAQLVSNNFPNDMVQTLNAGRPISGFTTATDWSLLSYIARVNYAYQGKYLFTGTLRRDGSSRFGANSKWGYFPSASFGWRISEEQFLSDVQAINDLKFRLSYGVTGNNLIPNYGSIGMLNTAYYASGNELLNGLYTDTRPSPDLRWERTNQVNIGLDGSLLRNRLNFSVDVYNSDTKGLLLDIPVPILTGFRTQLTNIGEVRNRGVEVLVTSQNLTGKLKWSTDLNWSLNRNQVMRLGPNDAPIIVTQDNATAITRVGEPIASYFGYIFDGVFMDDNHVNSYPHHPSTGPGDPIIRDVDGNGVINDNDRTVIGNYQPNFTASLTNTFRFENFDLSFMFHGVFGGEILNLQTRFSKFYNGGRNGYQVAGEYWKSAEEPGNGEVFKPYAVYPGLQTAFSTFWLEDRTHVRLRFVRLGYSLPTSVLGKLGMNALRVYFNAENPLVFTKYLGFDPENSVYGEGMRLGMDYGAYPIPRTFSLGIKAQF